jgi:DNA-directed RNA polymerase specialized sigma24 family protein
MSDWLSIVARHHKEYVQTVKGFGCDDYAEDLVQEMYIRLYKYVDPTRIIKYDQVNRGFIWFVLKNMYITLLKEKKRANVIRLGEGFEIEQEEIDLVNLLLVDNFTIEIEHELNEWEKDSKLWYDSMLFRLYINSGMSYRKLEELTLIHYKSIYDTVSKCKRKLKEKYEIEFNTIDEN